MEKNGSYNMDEFTAQTKRKGQSRAAVQVKKETHRTKFIK